MKTGKVINLALLGFLIISFACDDNMNNSFSQNDITALDGFRLSYTSAYDENEALKITLNEADSTGIHLHDSLYHHYLDLFEDHHSNYSHENNHDDHHHNSHKMHSANNSMDLHSNMDGHHNEDHELMDTLMNEHDLMTH